MKHLLKAAALALLAASPAAAQDAVSLRFANIFPPSNQLWAVAGKNFTDKVTAATDGRVTFEVYHSGQLGKDHVGVLRSGLADLAIVTASYTPDKLPLTSVAELPGNYRSSCEGTKLLWNVARQGGALNEAESRPQGMHILFVNQPPPYKLMTKAKPIRTVDDLAGLKFRSIGLSQIGAMKALGAVPVQMTSPEMYDSLARGTIDGAIFAYVGMPQFSLNEVIHNAVDNAMFGSPAILYAVSERTWEALPEDVRAAMTAAAEATQAEFCAFYDGDEARIEADYVAKGLSVSTLAPDVAEAMASRLAAVDEAWLATMTSVGRDGDALLAAYRAGAD